MKDEQILGQLYLFKLKDDLKIERVVLNIIGENTNYKITREAETNNQKKNAYPHSDINIFKSNRVLMEEDDITRATEIMRNALYDKMVETQDKAEYALERYKKFTVMYS